MQLNNTGRKLATAGAVLATTAGAAMVLALPAGAAAPATSAAQPTAQATASISRATVMKRAHAWIGKTSYTYTDGNYPGPGGQGSYRGDCSGFVSMALHLPGPGPSTVDLANVVKSIPAAQLKQGDLLGNLGPGTGGQAGHVQLFVRWANPAHTKVVVAEQGHLSAGGSAPSYPHEKTYSYPEHMSSGAALKPYRYKNIS